MQKTAIILGVIFALLLLSSSVTTVVGATTHWFGLASSPATQAASNTQAATDPVTAGTAPTSASSVATTDTAAPSTVTPGHTAPYVYIPFTDSPNFDISNSQAASIDACADLCTSTTGCQAIVYAPSNQTCWLKNALMPYNIVPYSNDRVYGYPAAKKVFLTQLVSNPTKMSILDALAAYQSKKPLQPDAIGTGYALVSPSQKYMLVMQSDGNTCIINLTSGKSTWCTSTNAKPNMPFSLKMQTDSNLVIYDSKNQAIWASQTYTAATGNTYTLVMQDDGNAVIYQSNANNSVVWASNTAGK